MGKGYGSNTPWPRAGEFWLVWKGFGWDLISKASCVIMFHWEVLNFAFVHHENINFHELQENNTNLNLDGHNLDYHYVSLNCQTCSLKCSSYRPSSNIRRRSGLTCSPWKIQNDWQEEQRRSFLLTLSWAPCQSITLTHDRVCW